MVKQTPKTGPRAKAYNRADHPARGGPVQWPRNDVDTRQPASSALRRKRLNSASRLASYPANTKFMPTRFEPENDNLWKIGPASIAQHGSAQDLQHPPGRTVQQPMPSPPACSQPTFKSASMAAAALSTTSSANVYGAASNTRTSISTRMTPCVSSEPA